jgi:histidine ammonia-lyase
MMSQVTAAALASECKLLAHPASVDSIPTDGNKEDVVPMAMGAALKLRRSVRNLRHVLAIELITGAEALEHPSSAAQQCGGRSRPRGRARIRRARASEIGPRRPTSPGRLGEFAGGGRLRFPHPRSRSDV